MGLTSRQNFFWIALVAALGLAASPGHAADGLPEKTTTNLIELDAATTATVYKFNVCRRVRNTNSLPILIPLAAAAEWTGAPGFLSNLSDMSGVSVTKCASNGYDVAFCYYQMNSGGYGQFCGSTSLGTMNPRLLYTASAFDTSTAELKEIMALKDSHRCNVDAPSRLFVDPQGAYDEIKNDITWSAGQDWCLAVVYEYHADHMYEGGDSGSGTNITYGIMRVWNPAAN